MQPTIYGEDKYMRTPIYTVSEENYHQLVEWLEKTFSELGLSREEIYNGELLLEENFFHFATASGDENKFQAKVEVTKHFGEVSLRLIAPGKAYNPLNDIEEIPDDEQKQYSLGILKAHKDDISYARKNDVNIISIRVHRSGNKIAIYTLIGLVVGIVVGIGAKSVLAPDILIWLVDNIFDTIEKLFMSALMMVIAPLVFFSVIEGITSMSDAADIGRMGGKLILLSIVKLSVILVMSIGLGFWLGAMPDLISMLNEESNSAVIMSLKDVMISIVPPNIIAPFFNNNLLQVLFLACFLGFILAKSGDRGLPVREVIVFGKRFAMDAVRAIMPAMPIVVAASMAKMMIIVDISVFLPFSKIVISAFIEFLIIILSEAVFLAIIGRVSPLPFVKKFLSFSVLPFSVRSSNVCLPATLEYCSDKLGIDEKLALFSVPIGIQFNMLGGCAYVTAIAILLRVTIGLPFDFEFLITFFFAALMMSFTFPSVPGATVIVMTSIFGMAGVPTAAVTLFFGIDPLVDGIRTVSNMVGNLSSSFLLARLEGKLDKHIYYE